MMLDHSMWHILCVKPNHEQSVARSIGRDYKSMIPINKANKVIFSQYLFIYSSERSIKKIFQYSSSIVRYLSESYETEIEEMDKKGKVRLKTVKMWKPSALRQEEVAFIQMLVQNPKEVECCEICREEPTLIVEESLKAVFISSSDKATKVTINLPTLKIAATLEIDNNLVTHLL